MIDEKTRVVKQLSKDLDSYPELRLKRKMIENNYHSYLPPNHIDYFLIKKTKDGDFQISARYKEEVIDYYQTEFEDLPGYYEFIKSARVWIKENYPGITVEVTK